MHWVCAFALFPMVMALGSWYSAVTIKHLITNIYDNILKFLPPNLHVLHDMLENVAGLKRMDLCRFQISANQQSCKVGHFFA